MVGTGPARRRRFPSGRKPVLSPSEGHDRTPIFVYQAVARSALIPGCSWMLKLIVLKMLLCSTKGRVRATQLTMLLSSSAPQSRVRRGGRAGDGPQGKSPWCFRN